VLGDVCDGATILATEAEALDYPQTKGKERMVARDSGFRIDAAGAGGYLRDGSHLPSFLAALAGRGFEF